MKKLFSIFMIAAVFTGCSYDDDEIWGRVNDLDSRISQLEQAAQSANQNISTLQSIVSALQGAR